jgi:small conductance mechanosensitive channel
LALHALVLVASVLLTLGHLGFDIAVMAPISLLIIMVIAVIIFFIVPMLPELPFKIGYMVEIDNVMGTVESISPMFTHVQTFDGKTIFIPNATVWTRKIINYHSTPNRRVELALNVSADNGLADARAVLTEIMHGDERVLDDPVPEVRINAAKAEGVNMVGLCWVKNADFLNVRSNLYEKVVIAAQSDAGISLSFDQKQLLISGNVTSR